MNITTKSVNYEAPEAAMRRAREKFGAVERFLGEEAPTALLEIELGKATEHRKSGDIYEAEANLTSGGKLHRAVRDADTIEKAIDAAASDLVRSVRSERGRARRMLRGAGARMKSLLRFGRL